MKNSIGIGEGFQLRGPELPYEKIKSKSCRSTIVGPSVGVCAETVTPAGDRRGEAGLPAHGRAPACASRRCVHW